MAKGYEIRDRHGRLVEHGDDKPLRDGERLKVPLMFRDHMTPLQRAVAEDAARRRIVQRDPFGREISSFEEEEEVEGKDSAMTDDDDAPLTVCDALGRTDPVSLGIPGPRFLRAGRNTADHARLLTADAERQEAYAEMVDSMQNEWRDAPPDAPAGSYPYSAAKETLTTSMSCSSRWIPSATRPSN
jgi:hypothetical protein